MAGIFGAPTNYTDICPSQHQKHNFSCIKYSYILFNSSWFTTLNTFCYGLRQTSVRSEPWAAISLNSVSHQCNGCRAFPIYITYITVHTIQPCLSNAMAAKHTLAKHTMIPCLTSAMVTAHYHKYNITMSQQYGRLAPLCNLYLQPLEQPLRMCEPTSVLTHFHFSTFYATRSVRPFSFQSNRMVGSFLLPKLPKASCCGGGAFTETSEPGCAIGG